MAAREDLLKKKAELASGQGAAQADFLKTLQDQAAKSKTTLMDTYKKQQEAVALKPVAPVEPIRTGNQSTDLAMEAQRAQAVAANDFGTDAGQRKTLADLEKAKSEGGWTPGRNSDMYQAALDQKAKEMAGPTATPEEIAATSKALSEYHHGTMSQDYVNTGGWWGERSDQLKTDIAGLEKLAGDEASLANTEAIANMGKQATSFADKLALEKSIVNPAQNIEATLANRVKIGQAGPTQVSRVGDVADINAVQIGDVGQTGVAQIAPMSQAEIAQIAALTPVQIAQIAAIDPVRAAKIEQAQQAQVRTGQMNLITQLQAQAAGEGPSLAGAQLKTAQNRNLAQQLAIAGQNRGGNQGLQARQLQQNMAVSGQELANQSAQARMQEQLNAQTQLGQNLQATRGQDIGLATSQAELEQRAFSETGAQQAARTMKQADLAQSAFSQTSAEAATRGISQAQIESATNQFNAAQANLAKVEQAKIQQEANLKDIDTKLRTALANGDLKQAANLANQKKNTEIALQNSTNQQNAFQTDATNAQRSIEAQGQADVNLNIADQSASMLSKTTNAANALKVQELQLNEKQFNDNRADQYRKMGMSAEAASKQSGLDYNMFLQNLGSKREDAAANYKIAQLQTDSAYAISKEKNAMDKQIADQKQVTDIAVGTLNAATNIMPKPGSDKRIKKDVKSGEKDISDFLNALDSKKYKYKNPGSPGQAAGEHFSVMAQDLEKTKVGKSMVEKDSEGVRHVDYGRGFGAILAAQVELNKRLAALESKKGKR